MSKKSEDFPLDKVSSVQWGSGLMLGAITIFASANKAEIKSVDKDDGKEIVDLVRARLSARRRERHRLELILFSPTSSARSSSLESSRRRGF